MGKDSRFLKRALQQQLLGREGAGEAQRKEESTIEDSEKRTGGQGHTFQGRRSAGKFRAAGNGVSVNSGVVFWILVDGGPGRRLAFGSAGGVNLI